MCCFKKTITSIIIHELADESFLTFNYKDSVNYKQEEIKDDNIHK